MVSNSYCWLFMVSRAYSWVFNAKSRCSARCFQRWIRTTCENNCLGRLPTTLWRRSRTSCSTTTTIHAGRRRWPWPPQRLAARSVEPCKYRKVTFDDCSIFGVFTQDFYTSYQQKQSEQYGRILRSNDWSLRVLGMQFPKVDQSEIVFDSSMFFAWFVMSCLIFRFPFRIFARFCDSSTSTTRQLTSSS